MRFFLRQTFALFTGQTVVVIVALVPIPSPPIAHSFKVFGRAAAVASIALLLPKGSPLGVLAIIVNGHACAYLLLAKNKLNKKADRK